MTGGCWGGRALGAVTSTSAALLLTAAPASAHTALVDSSPADGATASTPVTSVVLTFSEPVSTRLAAVVVRGADGVVLTEGPARVSGATVTQPVRPATAPGRTAVAYRVVAADGHPVTGELSYTGAGLPPAPSPTVGPTAAVPVAPQTRQPSPTSRAADSSPGDGSTRAWALPTALVGLAAVGGAAAAASRRRSPRREVGRP